MSYRRTIALILRRNITGLRKPYNDSNITFLEDHILEKDPIKLFDVWFNEAKNNSSIIEPNVMCLATATKEGEPSARFVLCKGYGADGFYFYTHYTSRKGKELSENPNVALTFYWDVLHKSVRIEGTARKLPISYAVDYFNSRPYNSQIGALCSDQSKQIESRAKLLETAEELMHKYKEGEVPKPESWGGYAVTPKFMEFWQGQTDRIHDRIRFRQRENDEIVDNILVHEGEGNWVYERLQP